MNEPDGTTDTVGIPDTDGKRKGRDDVYEFGAQVDGYAFFGDAWGPRLAELRQAFGENGELPWDIPTLHAWLALEIRSERFVELDDVFKIHGPDGTVIRSPDPEVPTRARIRHERRKNAIVDRIRALTCAKTLGLPAPSAAEPLAALIPRTPMLERYVTVKHASERVRLKLAERDRDNPHLLAEDLLRSVAMLEAYDNRAEAFHDPRPDPPGGPSLWKTKDVTHHLAAVGGIRGVGELDADYVGREAVLTRTKSIRPSHELQRVPLVRVDAVLRACDTGRPVLTEIKTPTDVDAYDALIQILTGASQLLTRTQLARLAKTYPDTTFNVTADRPQVDVMILTVDPERCGHPWGGPEGDPKYRGSLDRIAGEIAASLLDTHLTTFIPRLSNISLGVDNDGLNAKTIWPRSSDTADAPPS